MGFKPQKIPFWSTVGKSYGLGFANFLDFIRLAWLLIAIHFAINFYAEVPQFETQLLLMSGARLPGLNFYISNISSILLWSIFIVVWHRFILLNEKHDAKLLYVNLGKREFFVFLSWLLIFLCGHFLYIGGLKLTVVSNPMALHPTVSVVMGYVAIPSLIGIAVLIFIGRFILIYPRLALEKPIGISPCWQETKKNGFRIFFGFMLCVLPVAFLNISTFPLYYTDPQIWQLLASVTGPLFMVMWVSFASLCFQFIHENTEEIKPDKVLRSFHKPENNNSDLSSTHS